MHGDRPLSQIKEKPFLLTRAPTDNTAGVLSRTTGHPTSPSWGITTGSTEHPTEGPPAVLKTIVPCPCRTCAAWEEAASLDSRSYAQPVSIVHLDDNWNRSADPFSTEAAAIASLASHERSTVAGRPKVETPSPHSTSGQRPSVDSKRRASLGFPVKAEISLEGHENGSNEARRTARRRAGCRARVRRDSANAPLFWGRRGDVILLRSRITNLEHSLAEVVM